jgi:ribonuclease HII
MLVCGIDEAGKGPLIGDLVMAGAMFDEEGTEKLEKLGVTDSKLILPKKREELFKKIIKIAKDYKILVVGPKEVDEAVLSKEGMNLNWLEAHKAADIINALKPDKAIIDCPSTNISAYKEYFMNLIKNKEMEAVVEHKADLNYVECAAASILAKVTRDEEIEKLKKKVGIDFGSGYMADPKTKAFFDENFTKHHNIFRKSWAPYKKKIKGMNQKGLNEFSD